MYIIYFTNISKIQKKYQKYMMQGDALQAMQQAVSLSLYRL